MAPEPLHRYESEIGPIDRWRVWSWDGREIDMESKDLPPLVRPAILAYQDASTDEERDIAEVLVWTVELHPTWTTDPYPTWNGGGCTTCGTKTACPDQVRANALAAEFLIRKSTALVRRSRTNIARFDQKRAQREA